MEWPRAIIHMDLDAFYASVEQLRRPELRGLPVIVGGAGPEYRRGVVSAASYEARKFGVQSAMPLGRALRLCPRAVVLPVDFTAYRAASASVFAIAREYTPLLEPLSLDEAYLEVTASTRRFGEPEMIAASIRERVLAECGLHVSCGIATSKVVAKVASDLRKPRGFVVVPPGSEAEFLAPLPVRRLPGLGPATETALAALGITHIGEIAATPVATLRRRLGEHAAHSLSERARGVDRGTVTVPGRPKSVSREETFSTDVNERERLHQHLRACAADVGRQLRRDGWAARTATLKLRYQDFTTISRQVSWQSAQAGDTVIAAAGIALFDAAWNGGPVRLLGLGVSGIVDGAQMDLFGDTVPVRDARLDSTLDTLRARFGDAAPHRGAARALRDADFRGEDLRAQAAASHVEKGAHQLDHEDSPAAFDDHVDEQT